MATRLLKVTLKVRLMVRLRVKLMLTGFVREMQRGLQKEKLKVISTGLRKLREIVRVKQKVMPRVKLKVKLKEICLLRDSEKER